MCLACRNLVFNAVIKNELTARRVDIWKKFDARLSKYESQMMPVVKKLFKQQKSDLLDRIIKSASFENGVYKAKNRDVIDQWIDTEKYHAKWDAIFGEALEPVILGTIVSEGTYAGSRFVSGFSFEVSNENAQNIMGKYLEHITDLNETTRNELYVELQEAYKNGESIREIANRIQDIFDDADKVRAERIARTETISASNEGAVMGYKEVGVEKKEWISTIDARTRGIDAGDMFDHVSIDGKVVNIDEPFIVSGEELMYPGDSSRGASLGNFINCRCAIAGVVV